MIGSAPGEHIWSLYGATQCPFYQIYVQIPSKISHFGHQISIRTVTLCHKDMHSLLLDCILATLHCQGMIKSVSDSKSDPLMVNMVFVSTKTAPKFQAK